VLAIGDKSRLTDDDVHDLASVIDDDEGVATAIVRAARTSMGRDLSEADMEIVMAFAKRTASLAKYRKQLSSYLASRMSQVAPNLQALIGDTVAARLISKAGSLTNLRSVSLYEVCCETYTDVTLCFSASTLLVRSRSWELRRLCSEL
jgi:nucleolar protein 56